MVSSCRVTKQGHEVIFGVRDINALKVQTLLAETENKAIALPLAEATQQAEVVALTVPWESVPEVLQVVGTLDGKILLDATNPLIVNRLDAAVELSKSGSEQVATWFTGARVVKIFNTIGWEVMDNPQFGSESAMLASDDAYLF